MFNFRKSKFTFLSLLIALVLIFGAQWLSGSRTEKAEALSMTNFGGPVLMSLVCCDGIMIVVGPPAPGRFLFGISSIPYAWYNFATPGANVLGTYNPGGSCRLLPYCYPIIPLDGTIGIIGSSGLGI
ncbi:MAG: hypothetical protein U9M92_01545 [Patescibacteria group bacterium]|nr:hypothetical protein [Patescibacteria group bacterium]